jgi:hypothetical protein
VDHSWIFVAVSVAQKRFLPSGQLSTRAGLFTGKSLRGKVQLDPISRPSRHACAEEVVILGPDRALEEKSTRDHRPIIRIPTLDAGTSLGFLFPVGRDRQLLDEFAHAAIHRARRIDIQPQLEA